MNAPIVNEGDLAVRQPLRIRADPARVIAKLFVPGHPDDDINHQVLATVDHILTLDEGEVSRGLVEVTERFGGRHRDLVARFDRSAERVADRIPPGHELSTDRWLLLGATFTHEYSVEAAAVCNPSFVVAPQQPQDARGSVELVMSKRGIGEGHRSSIGFSSVSVDEDGQVSVPPPSTFAGTGTVSGSTLHAGAFRGLARRLDDDVESTEWVLARLGEAFTHHELDGRLAELEARGDTRPRVYETVRRLRALAARAYRIDFPPSSELSERVLYPVTPAELNGVEDARFVRFVDGDDARYYATYTAYDGFHITQQLLETTDFCGFESSPMQGPAARNKGMALFPRRIGGHFAALTRHDGATNAVAFTDEIRHWPAASPLELRPMLWNAIQVGNCGSPIETDHGWLVLTHGVGPMRTYSIGACLLDLDDPRKVVAELRRPLLTPTADEQDGYVPNVLYSCGAVRHGRHLVIPYGVGDASIGFASVPVDTLVAEMDER